MDWVSVLVAALCGALAAVIASLLTIKSKKSRSLYVVITVVMFFVLRALSEKTLLPRVRDWQTDRQLRELPFYHDLAEVDPQTYEKIRAVASDSVRKGDGADTIASRIAPIVAGMVPKYIGAASDDSVNDFVKATTREIEMLNNSHSDACYYFLFPHEQGAPLGITTNSLDPKIGTELLDILGRIVHSSVHTPQALPDTAKAGVLLVPVMGQLRNEFGNDLFLLQQKPVETVGRQKVCAITISLYKNIEALPQSDASLVLRYLMAGTGTSNSEK